MQLARTHAKQQRKSAGARAQSIDLASGVSRRGSMCRCEPRWCQSCHELAAGSVFGHLHSRLLLWSPAALCETKLTQLVFGYIPMLERIVLGVVSAIRMGGPPKLPTAWRDI